MTAAASEPAPAAAARPKLPNFVGFALAVAIVWLGGQFVRQGVSDSFLATSPELAVLWLGNSSDAVTELARVRFKGHDAQGAARLSAKALQLWPLNEPALTLYGMAIDQQNQHQAADAAVGQAGELGWRDVLTQMWLFRRDVLAGRYASGFRHADALMRRQDAPSPIVLQILAVATAHDPKAIGPLVDRLATNPSWRGRFLDFLSLGLRPPQPDVAEAVLTRLAATRAPPTDAEVSAFLTGLVVQGQFARAEADWRRFSPGSASPGSAAPGSAAPGSAGGAALVHDGDFERAPGTTPFDWSLGGGVGWTPVIDDSPGQGHGKALKLEYDGVSAGKPLVQLVVLAPGAYHLSGRFYDEGGVGAQTLAWTVTCADAPAPAVKGAPASSSGDEPVSLVTALPPIGAPNVWRPFSANFTVPSSGCPAAWLRLAPQPGDVRQDVVVWYDDLAITPGAGAAPPS